jgi:dTDP-4-dehydrorhamnose 3,5-epimerase
MKITPLDISDILIIEPDVFHDNRGFFYESFNIAEFRKLTSLHPNFVQDNHTKSSIGVLRGLHYQLPPYSQAKLARVIQGEILDVVVDIRKYSPTFGQYVTHILSAKNKKLIWIPEGFAHGYLTLSETSEFLYKVTNFYNPGYERCILWNDNYLNIDWPSLVNVEVSAKDALGKPFNEADYFY